MIAWVNKSGCRYTALHSTDTENHNVKKLEQEMKVFSSNILDNSLFYGIILLISCVFLFTVFEIYFDRKKNLWNLSGPFPLPLIGKEDFLNNLNLLTIQIHC